MIICAPTSFASTKERIAFTSTSLNPVVFESATSTVTFLTAASDNGWLAVAPGSPAVADADHSASKFNYFQDADTAAA